MTRFSTSATISIFYFRPFNNKGFKHSCSFHNKVRQSPSNFFSFKTQQTCHCTPLLPDILSLRHAICQFFHPRTKRNWCHLLVVQHLLVNRSTSTWLIWLRYRLRYRTNSFTAGVGFRTMLPPRHTLKTPGAGPTPVEVGKKARCLSIILWKNK